MNVTKVNGTDRSSWHGRVGKGTRTLGMSVLLCQRVVLVLLRA